MDWACSCRFYRHEQFLECISFKNDASRSFHWWICWNFSRFQLMKTVSGNKGIASKFSSPHWRSFLALMGTKFAWMEDLYYLLMKIMILVQQNKTSSNNFKMMTMFCGSLSTRCPKPCRMSRSQNICFTAIFESFFDSLRLLQTIPFKADFNAS